MFRGNIKKFHHLLNQLDDEATLWLNNIEIYINSIAEFD